MPSMNRKVAAAVDGSMTLAATGMKIIPAPNPANPRTQPATNRTAARNTRRPGGKELKMSAMGTRGTDGIKKGLARQIAGLGGGGGLPVGARPD
ncbi:hypothetical protein ROS1_01790 [Roseibium sp. ROS1]